MAHIVRNFVIDLNDIVNVDISKSGTRTYRNPKASVQVEKRPDLNPSLNTNIVDNIDVNNFLKSNNLNNIDFNPSLNTEFQTRGED